MTIRQNVMLFEDSSVYKPPIDKQINIYLENHPEYVIDNIIYSENPQTNRKTALVVFGVAMMYVEQRGEII